MIHFRFLFSSQRGKILGLILHFLLYYFNSFSHISTIINTIKQNIQISEKNLHLLLKNELKMKHSELRKDSMNEPRSAPYMVWKSLKMSHFEYFNLGIFHPFLSYLKLSCLEILIDSKIQFFEKSPKWTIFGIFKVLLDIFCNFQIPWFIELKEKF